MFSYETQDPEAAYDPQMRFIHRIRDNITKREILLAALVVVHFSVTTLFGLNIEAWAEKHGYDKLLSENENQLMEWLLGIYQLLVSDLVLGFAVGGLFFSFWGSISRLFVRPSIPQNELNITKESAGSSALYEPAPQETPPDDPAVRERLTEFYLDYVEPAVKRCRTVQWHCILRITDEDPSLRELMKRGMENANGPISDLYRSYYHLMQAFSDGRPPSGAELSAHLAIIKSGYWGTCVEAGKLLKHERIDPTNNEQIAKPFREWARANNALIEEANKIGRDTRLGPLYRPGKTGEWGRELPEAWNKNAV